MAKKRKSKGEIVAAKVARKAKTNRKFAVALVVIVLLLVAALVITYVLKPELINSIFTGFDTNNGSDTDTNTGGDNNSNSGENNNSSGNYSGDLLVYFFDVGQGDSIYIQFPDGKDMIIDCANYNNTASIKNTTLAKLDELNPDDTIDYLMLTHCDSDHVYFLDEVIDMFQINNIYMPNVLATHNKVSTAGIDSQQIARFTDSDVVSTACYADFFIAALTEPNCVVNLNIGNFTISGADYTFNFYCYTQEEWDATKLNSAEEKNAVSPIGILNYNNRRIVFTGDSNEINEPKFIEKVGTPIDCDVLKVGHHGSATSSGAEFLDFITCEYAVISCNKSGNSFSHPRQETLDRLVARNMSIYRTDLNGMIRLQVTETDLIFTVEKEASIEDLRVGGDIEAA